MKKVSILTVVMAAAMTSSAAFAEVSGNIGATSNYIWRGVTQSGDASSVSGGIDYSHESGVYAGVWTAGLVNDTETDYYVGYSGEAGGIGYDVGYIKYTYNLAGDFSEVYVGGSMDMFSAKYSIDSDNKNSYLEVAADMELTAELGLSVHYGMYAFDTGTDYNDFSVAITKGDFAVTISDTSESVQPGGISGPLSENSRVAVSWGATF